MPIDIGGLIFANIVAGIITLGVAVYYKERGYLYSGMGGAIAGDLFVIFLEMLS